MEYKQRTTCEGCKALHQYTDAQFYYCELSFYIDATEGIPLEECPKPKYADDFYACKMLGFHKWARNAKNGCE